MNRYLVFIVVLILSVSFACAARVAVLDLTFDNGRINLNDISYKEGYYPDRIIDEGPYLMEVLDDAQNVEYSFRLKDPSLVFVDGLVNGEVSGGVIRMDERNFSLIIPYDERFDSVRVKDSRERVVGKFNIKQSELKNNLLWVWLAIVILIVIISTILLIRSKKAL